MKNVRTYPFLFLMAGSILAIDQFTKWLVRENILLGHSWLPENLAWLEPYARIVHWYNTGAAFGLFHGQNLAWLFTLLAMLVSGLIIVYYAYVEEKDRLLRLAMSMQLGGALGNLTDRLMRDGAVTDFISVGNFPVFNVADASITVGTGVMLLAVWMMEKADKKQPRQQDVVSDTAQGDGTALEEVAE